MSGAAAGGAGSVVAGATGRGSGRGGGGGRRKKKMAKGREDRERASARLRLPVAGAIASSPPNLGASRIFTVLARLISICGNISFHWFHLHKMAGEVFSLL